MNISKFLPMSLQLFRLAKTQEKVNQGVTTTSLKEAACRGRAMWGDQPITEDNLMWEIFSTGMGTIEGMSHALPDSH